VARILIVEDNDPVRWALSTLLRSRGHQVDQVANGRQALAAFAAHSFDVVLTDLYMPLMDGFEVCRRIRKRSRVPILMFSTNRDPLVQERALDYGASDFLPKPFEFDHVLAWVRKTGGSRSGTFYNSLAYLN
jgi:DNA-binding response OmpR family regulator